MAPNFLLGSKKSSTCHGAKSRSWPARVGWVKCRYASGFFAPAALLGKERVSARPRLGRAVVMDDHFEHPECSCECN